MRHRLYCPIRCVGLGVTSRLNYQMISKITRKQPKPSGHSASRGYYCQNHVRFVQIPPEKILVEGKNRGTSYIPTVLRVTPHLEDLTETDRDGR